MFGKWPEFHGLSIFDSLPVIQSPAVAAFTTSVLMHFALRSLTGDVDHFLEKLQCIILVGQGIGKHAPGVLLTDEIGDGIDKNGFPVAAPADEKESGWSGQGFMEGVTDCLHCTKSILLGHFQTLH